MLTRSAVLLPLVALGFAPAAVNMYVILVGLQAVLAHANLGLRFGVLEYLFVLPRYHHWHHSSDDEAIDKNYVAHLPAIDWIFGTFYMPKDSTAWPRKYGTIGIPLPKGIVRQFFYPFQQQAKTIRSGLRQEHKRAA